ncbi:hypothetical protein DPMN_170370 [Dreissena polymorpha]|uniref:Uncharacterized protein n=1 Tax=Dreissena polymorpha TaxID=45954 RepID=A0A9D4DW22_DREPO|nr:hypothetical protein DPMN_170370 [Dreissena polymorpha]
MIGQKLKTAPPTGGHVFQRIGTAFELNQVIINTNILTNFELGRDFIGTKLLTKFHEDGTRNVASRVTDGQTYDGQRPVTKAHLSNQIKLVTKFGLKGTKIPRDLIQLLTKFGEIQLLTKFGEDLMKTT